MKINLNDSETNELIGYYNNELDKLQKRKEDILSIISKLSSGEDVTESPAAGATSRVLKKRGRKSNAERKAIATAGNTTVATPAKGKRGRKKGSTKLVLSTAKAKNTTRGRGRPRKAEVVTSPTSAEKVIPTWTKYIVDTLKAKNAPLRPVDILNLATKTFKLNKANKKKAQAAITNGMARMVTVNKTLTRKVDSKGKTMYGLPEWK